MGKEEYFPLSEIAKEEQISPDYLEKIFSQLEKERIVKSKKGPGGGYLLKKNPSQIKIGEILEILEGEINLVQCINGDCQRKESCLTVNIWKKINKTLRESLFSLSLKDLKL